MKNLLTTTLVILTGALFSLHCKPSAKEINSEDLETACDYVYALEKIADENDKIIGERDLTELGQEERELLSTLNKKADDILDAIPDMDDAFWKKRGECSASHSLTIITRFQINGFR